jgi:excisionase family DNA binding protein
MKCPHCGHKIAGAMKMKEASCYLASSPMTVRRLIERGLLRPNRATRHLLFSVEELDRFLRDYTTE